MTVKIERMRFEDIPFAAAILMNKAEEIGDPFDGQGERYLYTYLLRCVKEGSPIALVAVLYGKRQKKTVVGVLTFTISQHPFGKVIAWGEQIAVRREYRDGMVGGMLMREAEKIATEHGASKAYLETIVPDLFKGFGYKIDRTIMVKDLVKKDGNTV